MLKPLGNYASDLVASVCLIYCFICFSSVALSVKVALCINFPSRLNPDNLTNAGDIHVYTSGLKTHLSSAKNCKQINFDPSQSLRISVTLQINSSRLKSVQQRNRSLFDLISDNSPKGKCKKCILGKLCVTGDCSEKRPFTNILIPDSSSGPDSLWIDINISLTLVTSYSSCESFPTRTADLISPLSPGSFTACPRDIPVRYRTSSSGSCRCDSDFSRESLQSLQRKLPNLRP